MKNLANLNEIKTAVTSPTITLLYFYGDNCGVCTVIKDILEKELNKFPKLNAYKIYAEDNMEAFTSHNIFTLPVVLVYINGTEYLREARNISTRDLLASIDRLYNLYYEN
ncbi:thioredoxin family protein [Clostridium frigidicarnis]|uniref:Thioredoxin n=1 Tax=Clostridium frigidicarnis TaxID=84698 RepID=A0A1I1A442_9CLOT|nr:thioredoxin family protein [Clostridium frigidicarnis]SFB31338.1 Thioredoxin [Clostridium frigidicarnis]